jgi:hypothetical protein
MYFHLTFSWVFRAHKEVLFFASPFFEAALSGGWAETGRPPSMSSVITISQPPSNPGDKDKQESPAITFTPMDPESEDIDQAFDSDNGGKSENGERTASESDGSDAELINLDEPGAAKEPLSSEDKAKARDLSLAQLQSGGDTAPTRSRDGKKLKMRRYVRTSDGGDGVPPKLVFQPAQATVTRRPKASGPDAVIVLKEERVCILCICVFPISVRSSPRIRRAHSTISSNTYIHSKSALHPIPRNASTNTIGSLDCTITWNNVEGLMNISHKLCVPSLQHQCLKFLLTHAAGKPIKAMRIAELFEEEELYRESSRFVLDNPGGWTEQELSTLSQETLLKLEKR